ncbi:hypothetical protein DSO57_1000952 [Entomophthora muscae]|uniref:Uncharacterized protein n=1 Tax=Entomophthora muscae TaxID=34485 RepID=A0ACC2TKK7_9FUNG|nr:hypothetical protein DSO57_1000952 [Entomophthora muscae]
MDSLELRKNLCPAGNSSQQCRAMTPTALIASNVIGLVIFYLINVSQLQSTC